MFYGRCVGCTVPVRRSLRAAPSLLSAVKRSREPRGNILFTMSEYSHLLVYYSKLYKIQIKSQRFISQK
jgi:hypothetical protein